MANIEVNKYLIDRYLKNYPGEAARILSSLSLQEQGRIFKCTPAENAGEILSRMNPDRCRGNPGSCGFKEIR